MMQLSQLYMTTGETTALTRLTFAGKMMSLLFNTLFSFVTAFLPRSNHLLISWAAIIVCSDFGAQEKKICHCFHFSLSVCHELMGPDTMILVF